MGAGESHGGNAPDEGEGKKRTSIFSPTPSLSSSEQQQLANQTPSTPSLLLPSSLQAFSPPRTRSKKAKAVASALSTPPPFTAASSSSSISFTSSSSSSISSSSSSSFSSSSLLFPSPQAPQVLNPNSQSVSQASPADSLHGPGHGLPHDVGKVVTCTEDGDAVVTAANTREIAGRRVYVVDEATGVFVFNLLTPAECDEIVRVADEHISEVGSDATKTWRKLYT